MTDINDDEINTEPPLRIYAKSDGDGSWYLDDSMSSKNMIAYVPETELADLEMQLEIANDKLHQIKTWCNAYPLSVFIPPDWGKAREALESAGMTLDAVSAANMRHVLKGVMEIIEKGGE